jgi:DNA-binding NarL/FixJ family response regulator
MSVNTVIVILRARAGEYPAVAPPPYVGDLAFDGAYDARGLQKIARIEPHVVMLDLRGLSEPIGMLIGAAKLACPAAHVLAIGMPYDEHMAEQAIAAGASGFLTRDLGDQTLATAITNCSRKGMHFTSTGLRAMNKLVDAHNKEKAKP